MAARDGQASNLDQPRESAKGPSRAIWSALDAGVAPVASLLIAGGLVRTLGAHDYGLVVIALAVSGLSTAISPAIAASTTRFIAEASGNRRLGTGEIARVITASLVMVIAMGILLTAIAVCLGKPLCDLIFGQSVAHSTPDTYAILILAVVSICFQQIDGVFAAALKGLEQFKRQGIVEACIRFVLAAAVTLIAWLTGDIELVLIVYSLVFVASSVVRARVVRACLEDRRLFLTPGWPDFRLLMSFGGWMWLNAIATIAYGSADRIVIGRFAGAAAAAQYNIYSQLTQLVHFIPASLFAFTYPVFSRLGAQRAGGQAELTLFYRRYLRTAVLVSLCMAAVLMLCSHPLLRLVSGGAFAQQSELLFPLLVFGFLILSVCVVPYCLVLGLGGSRPVSLITSGSMIGSVAAMAFLTPALGVEGAALARLVYGFGALTLFIQAHRRLARNEIAA